MISNWMLLSVGSNCIFVTVILIKRYLIFEFFVITYQYYHIIHNLRILTIDDHWHNFMQFFQDVSNCFQVNFLTWYSKMLRHFHVFIFLVGWYNAMSFEISCNCYQNISFVWTSIWYKASALGFTVPLYKWCYSRVYNFCCNLQYNWNMKVIFNWFLC